MGDLLICLNSVLPSLLEVCQLLLEVCQLASPLAGGCLLQRQRLLSLAKPAPQPEEAAQAWHSRKFYWRRGTPFGIMLQAVLHQRQPRQC